MAVSQLTCFSLHRLSLLNRCTWLFSFKILISSFFETHFKIKISERILRRFDLSEIIFKFKKANRTLHIRSKITRENMRGQLGELSRKIGKDIHPVYTSRKIGSNIKPKEMLVKWIKTFYANPQSCVTNNGFATPFFPVERGVRQGCPLSGILFVIGVELLASAIRSDKVYRLTQKNLNYRSMLMTLLVWLLILYPLVIYLKS